MFYRYFIYRRFGRRTDHVPARLGKIELVN